MATLGGGHCMICKSQSVDGKNCFARTFGVGADAGGCHCCQCSTPKWLTLVSRVEFSFLKKPWTRFSNLTKSRCRRHCTASEKRPKNWGFFINFIRILWFIWDLELVLFDSQKDAVSGGKKFVFGNILGFLGLNWTQKCTKTINFGYVLFPLKHLILKDCSETVFVLWKTYLWLKFQQTRVIFAGERAQKPPKRGHFMDAALPRKHLKIYNLTTTNAALMKLTTIMYLHKMFNLAEDWGVTHRMQEGINQKRLKMSQKIIFFFVLISGAF